MSQRLGTRFGSMFREESAPARPRNRGKIRNARRPRRETSSPFGVTSSTDDRGQRVTYTIGELVAEAYARASRVTSDPAIEAILATRLLAAWLARSTLSSTGPASAARGTEAAWAGAVPVRKASSDNRRSRASRTGAQRGRLVTSHAHRAVA